MGSEFETLYLTQLRSNFKTAAGSLPSLIQGLCVSDGTLVVTHRA